MRSRISEVMAPAFYLLTRSGFMEVPKLTSVPGFAQASALHLIAAWLRHALSPVTVHPYIIADAFGRTLCTFQTQSVESPRGQMLIHLG